MDAKAASVLRARWSRSPCTHQDAAKESGQSGPTGNYVCTTCGETWWGHAAWQEERERALERYGGERPER